MHRAAPRKKAFTAEIQRRRRLSGESADAPVAASEADGGSDDVLEEIRRLQTELHSMHQLVRQHYEPEDQAEEESAEVSQERREFERQRDEVNLLKMELRALANSIQETKREIAQLRSGEEESDRLTAVASELDAVVGSTEKATEGILDSAEKIDTIAHNLKANAADAYTTHLAEELTEHVMTIFEHSNFQDITGQRITKVVNTLKFVEQRVDKMISIWGREAFQDLLDEDDTSSDEDGRLLNGPQQTGAGISQNEIDRLFD